MWKRTGPNRHRRGNDQKQYPYAILDARGRHVTCDQSSVCLPYVRCAWQLVSYYRLARNAAATTTTASYRRRRAAQSYTTLVSAIRRGSGSGRADEQRAGVQRWRASCAGNASNWRRAKYFRDPYTLYKCAHRPSRPRTGLSKPSYLQSLCRTTADLLSAGTAPTT